MLRNSLRDLELNNHDEDDIHVSSIKSEIPYLEIGKWCWVDENVSEMTKEITNNDADNGWLGCVMAIGSNYVSLASPRSQSGWRETRVHFDDVLRVLTPEPNAEQVIANKILIHQNNVKKHLADIKQITSRLGVSRQIKLCNAPQTQKQSSTDVAVISGQFDVKKYEASLILAEKETLPALFNAVKKDNEQVARWMSAEMMSMLAQSEIMEGAISEIKERVFNVSLYSGLIEDIVQCKRGEPAQYQEKLRVMQRILFMDEECLANYRTGGMEFHNINEFDAWLIQPDNLKRILPFERCLVAMRVRRSAKHRDWQGRIRIAFENMQKEKSDQYTFLYIRNGDNVYRLGSSSFEFDGAEKAGSPAELIFPSKALFNPGEPMMVSKSFRDFSFVSVSDFEQRCKETMLWEKNFNQWWLDNPLETWKDYDPKEDKHGPGRIKYLWEYANPYRGRCPGFINKEDWHEFNNGYIYYDEAVDVITNRLKKYNRIALLIQGLLDRSETLHPHPVVKTWEPQSFASFIELVYDGSAVLYAGEEPDIEAYIEKCNASLKVGSITVGQDLFWQKREAEKECRRLDNNWRTCRTDYRPTTFKPYGNPGPGYLAKVSSIKAGYAEFKWDRLRQTSRNYDESDLIPTKINVPVTEVFNISAYVAGDYRQFFQDPRTRAKYLEWAPLLITAEEYLAGNLTLNEE